MRLYKAILEIDDVKEKPTLMISIVFLSPARRFSRARILSGVRFFLWAQKLKNY